MCNLKKRLATEEQWYAECLGQVVSQKVRRKNRPHLFSSDTHDRCVTATTNCWGLAKVIKCEFLFSR